MHTIKCCPACLACVSSCPTTSFFDTFSPHSDGGITWHHESWTHITCHRKRNDQGSLHLPPIPMPEFSMWQTRAELGKWKLPLCAMTLRNTGTGKAVDQCWRAPGRGWVPYKGTLLDWQTLGFFRTLPPTNGRRWALMGAERGFGGSDYRCLTLASKTWEQC